MEPDADEDYMGDLSHFLPSSTSSSPSRHLGRRKQPPAPAQAQTQAKRGKGLPWKERRRQERERKQREEDARTMAGLAEAIPESNVGFRMLKQMGYDPGARGAAEPVGIEIRRSRAGLGAEPAVEPLAPEGEKDKEAEEEEDVITEEDLQNILSKLRDQYQYCLYCGCKYESAEALVKECPGPNEEDH